MSASDKLAEARIQEWLRRPEGDRSAAPVTTSGAVPLELQLFQDALRLYEEAAATAEDTPRRALLQRAADLEVRMNIVLETSGRHLTANHLSDALQAARARCR